MGGVEGDGVVFDPTGGEMDDKEDVEALAPESVHGEEVTGEEGIKMSLDERTAEGEAAKRLKTG